MTTTSWVLTDIFKTVCYLLLIQTGVSLSAVTKCYIFGSASGVTDDNCSDEKVNSKYSPTICPVVPGVTYNYCAVSKFFTLHLIGKNTYF